MIAEAVEDIVEKAQQQLLDLDLDREDEAKRAQVKTQRAGTVWSSEQSALAENAAFCSRALSCERCLYAAGSKGTHAFAVADPGAKDSVTVISPPESGGQMRHVVISQLVTGETSWDIVASAEDAMTDEQDSQLSGTSVHMHRYEWS